MSTDVEPELLEALVQTSYAVIGAITAVAGRHDLSLTLWRLMAILRDRTPTMSELATHLDLDRSSVTGLVDRAATRGLVRRVADREDRRSSRVALTTLGQDVARACSADLIGELAPLTAMIEPMRQRELARLLGSLGAVR